MRKRITAFLVSTVMVVSGLVQAFASTPYTDVPKNWAYSSIEKCYEKGWITGTSKTTFSPQSTLTRAQFVAILGRYAGADVKQYTTSTFSDVNFSGWGYAPFVSWAEEREIVHGMDATHFDPNGKVTRVQMATFLYNYVNYIGAKLPITKPGIQFKDEKSIPGYAKTAVMLLAEAGVISGSNGKFDPGEPCTREMTASFLVKFDNILQKASYGPEEPVVSTASYDPEKGGVVLTWDAIPGARGYDIYRREAGTYVFKKAVSGVTETTGVDTTISTGSRYEYCVRAYTYAADGTTKLSSTYGNTHSPEVFTSSTTFSIDANSRPAQPYYNKVATEETLFYYAMRDALEQIETAGGGTLIVKPGSYTLSGVLYIPDNTEIILEDGVTIKKANQKLGGMFVFVRPSQKDLEKIYSGYTGVHNSSVHGRTEDAKVVLDNNTAVGSLFEIGHASNIQVYNLNMINMDPSTHFIELAASSQIEIHHCTFKTCKDKGTEKEAINIDVPDPNTGGFSGKYSTQDKTATRNISVHDCVFKDLPVGVGTHMYTDIAPHKDIHINNNTFTNMYCYAINARNWENPQITGNTFDTVGFGPVSNFSTVGTGILVVGVNNPTITGNTFINMDRPVRIDPLQYKAASGVNAALLKYQPVLNYISDAGRQALYKNTLKQVSHPYYYFRNKSDVAYTLWFYEDPNQKDFTVGPDTIPYAENYMGYSGYTEDTKQYYAVRSYLEHMVEKGGGTLTLESGTYPIPMPLHIPDNVTLIMQPDTILLDTMPNSSAGHTMIDCRNKSTDIDNSEAYSAASNIHIIGGIIHTNGYNTSRPILMRKGSNISVENVKFVGISQMYIQISSCQDVQISGCSFDGAASERGIVMAHQTYDIPCKNITVQNCTFDNIRYAITNQGPSTLYNTDITIKNNTFTSCQLYALYLLNFRGINILNNTITDMGDAAEALRLQGVEKVTIQGNTFRDITNCGSIRYISGFFPNHLTAAEVNVLCTSNICDNTVLNPFITYRENVDTKPVTLRLVP